MFNLTHPGLAAKADWVRMEAIQSADAPATLREVPVS